MGLQSRRSKDLRGLMSGLAEIGAGTVRRKITKANIFDSNLDFRGSNESKTFDFDLWCCWLGLAGRTNVGTD